MIAPLMISSKDEEEWSLISSMVFKDSLFETEINVQMDGTVRLSNQEILVEDIPVLDDHFDIWYKIIMLWIIYLNALLTLWKKTIFFCFFTFFGSNLLTLLTP